MPITELLTKNATYFKDDVALVEINPDVKGIPRVTWREYSLIESDRNGAFRKQLTWGEFDVRANRFANLLLTRGIQKGDKVAILLMNCLDWLPIYFGILKAGAVAVPLNFRYTADEIKYCLEKSDSDALVFGPEFIGRVEQIIGSVPKVKNSFYVGDDCPSFADSYEKMISHCSSMAPSVYITDDDDGAIYFSSGTTGFPKAILHAHRSLSHSAKVEQAHHHQTKDDVFLCIPPLYHTGAKMHWFGSLISGGKAVLLRGVSPEWIIRCVSEERCTIVWLLVPWAQDILDAIESGKINLDNYELSQWRLMHIGAQPVPPTLIKRWKAIFPNHDYDTNYGLSESIGPGCVHLGIENTDKVGAIGIPGYGWEVKIVDPDRNEITDGVGELAVKGPGVMKCYYKDVKATEEVMDDDGWLYTGDMAERDEDGFIYLVDRKKDVIITGGENIYPVQIEDFLRSNNAVKDVAVIGLPDHRLGEIAAAVIEVKPGFSLTEDEVNDFCMALPRYKRPRKLIFADVPRNPTGKIEKPVLRKKYCGESVVAQQNEIKL
ncbi:MAG: class I adenylate-forming enzyme family protein [Ruminococcus sp.]|jgi:acyl-CoA synthetase (AMP-forming)/AMP-acid ligase II|nr:class I adenylate-forming enzyme family protein [Ruminococcus sp.]